MTLKSAASYEASLRAHKDPEVGRRLRPAYPPFWVESREINKHCTLSYIFYDDAVRGSLLHARELRSQAFPINRDDAPALDPSRCKGVWYLPTPELAERLKAVESDMIAAFESLKIGNAQGNVMPLAGYIRQLYDHFLYVLTRIPSARRDQGTFEKPIPLDSVEEPHMKNALNNKMRGQSYKVGAWVVGGSDTVGGESDKGSLHTTQRKRTRDTELQQTSTSTAFSNDSSTAALIAHSEADRNQGVARKPKRLRLITSVSPVADNLTQKASPSPGQSDDRCTASTLRSSAEQQETDMVVDSGGGSDTQVDIAEVEANADVGESEDDVDLGSWEVFLCTDYGQIRLVGSKDGKMSEERHVQIRYAAIPEAVAV